ncbi:MAG TPA: hypothetical protein VFZ59_12600 [Verrucomicrobiae bacterium]|nr:hypothetical protein [Verrucomicrobiae bacterium]
MNEHESESNCCGRGFSVTFAVVLVCLIFAALVWKTRQYTTPPALGAQRATERAKALAELRDAEASALDTVGWVDQAKGVVRLPIADAMKLTESRAQNPAEAHADLIARVEKATALPPKPPEKPSAFE